MSYTAPTVVASGRRSRSSRPAAPRGHLEKLITAQGAMLAPTVKPRWTDERRRHFRRSAGGRHVLRRRHRVERLRRNDGRPGTGPDHRRRHPHSADHVPVAQEREHVSRNVYIGAVNGSTGGPYILYARGITTSTYDLATAAPTNDYASTHPPTVNTTGFTYTDSNKIVHNKRLELLRACKDGNLEDVFRYLRQVIADFNRGNPMSYTSTISRLRDAHAVFAMLDTLCSEMGTLIDANPGTTGRTTNGIGNAITKRTWP